ncbi:MAG TPA: outer membrane beta-barrel protein [Gemmatimonadaceae bacterium]|nr:outer membrane beta-barrel protein [Gemmatimonadaceae bacterium]
MVKNVGKLIAICAIAAASAAGTAQAQRQAPNASGRDGFWISGGLGYGSLGCDNCGSREGGISGGLSLGGTITPRFLLGVGTSGWTKEEGGARLTVAEIDARVRFYPWTTGGFFLTGGVGYGSVTGSVGGFSATENGAGAILGMGYDVRIARNMSITPFWNGYAMKNSDTDANVGQIGLALTLH